MAQNKGPLIFISKFLLIYFGLTLFYDFYIEPKTFLDEMLIYSIIDQSEYLLKIFGYDLLPANTIYDFHFGILNTPGVIIGSPCNGISLFILYITFIAVFKGKWYSKVGLSLLGVSAIHLLNLVRVIALTLVVLYKPEMLDFHHKYTFTLFVYFCVFVMWILRVKIYQRKKI